LTFILLTSFIDSIDKLVLSEVCSNYPKFNKYQQNHFSPNFQLIVIYDVPIVNHIEFALIFLTKPLVADNGCCGGGLSEATFFKEFSGSFLDFVCALVVFLSNLFHLVIHDFIQSVFSKEYFVDLATLKIGFCLGNIVESHFKIVSLFLS